MLGGRSLAPTPATVGISTRRPQPFKPVCAAKNDDAASKSRKHRQKAAESTETPTTSTTTTPPSSVGIISPSLPRLQNSSDALKAILERRAQRRNLGTPSSLPPTSTASTTSSPLSSSTAPQPASLVSSSTSSSTPSTTDTTTVSTSSASSSSAATLTETRKNVRVRFWVNLHVDFGQSVVVVGSSPELGAWILAHAASMAWSEGDMWSASVEVPSGGVIEYKYVIVGQGGHAVSWQAGNNSVLAVRRDDESLEVYDNWYGNPGAQVAALGAEPVTREHRLLSWATEIEASMGRQRQELRRARMELVAAQEDARVAREETRRAKAALAVAEAERTSAMTHMRQAEATNKILQAQLVETTKSFKSAIETAVGLLEKASSSSSKSSSSSSSKTTTSAGTKLASSTNGGAAASSTPTAAASSKSTTNESHGSPATTPQAVRR